MNVFDYAMQMEKEGEAYYRELAKHSKDIGLKKIWTMFANNEAKHYRTLQMMKAGGDPQMAESTLLADAKNVFTEMKAKGVPQNLKISVEDLYKQALDTEKKSEEFYREKAKETENAHHKEIFLRIAEEERKHYFLFDQILDYLRAPQTWIENAEFNHLDEY